VITSLYLSLSEGENCQKLQSFGIKLSRLAFFGGKTSKIWKIKVKNKLTEPEPQQRCR